MNGILKVMGTRDIPPAFHENTNDRVNIQATKKQRDFSVLKRHVVVSVGPQPQLTLEVLGCLNENVNKLAWNLAQRVNGPVI